MLITRTSIYSGIERTMDIPITFGQLQLWEAGMNIQDAMPNLTIEQREFIMTGITNDEWLQMNGHGEEYNELD